MASGSHTTRTLRLLEKEGWRPWVVEKWIPIPKGRNPAGGIRRDLFNFIDVIAVRGTETLAVQCTAYSGVSSRVCKIEENEYFPYVCAAGWRVEVWGWRKPKHRWAVRKVKCDADHTLVKEIRESVYPEESE